MHFANFGCRFDHFGVTGKSEVVVDRDLKQFPAILLDDRGAVGDRELAKESVPQRDHVFLAGDLGHSCPELIALVENVCHGRGGSRR